MRATSLSAWTLLLGAAVLNSDITSAQNFPSKPIRMVVAGIGGASDIAARVLSDGLTASLGQPLVVDARPSGVIPVEFVAKAAPDGYTVLLSGGVLWQAPYIQANITYDPIKDFAPITLALSSPNVLVVHPSLPVKSVKELIALAKAQPGALNYGSAGVGSSSHLAAELFKSMAGVNLVGVSYKGAGQALTDLIGGQIQLIFATAPSATSYIKAGRLRGIAATSAQPSAMLPGLPTVAASGVPGYESILTQALVAPAKTPPANINRLNEEIVRVINKPEVKDRLANSALEVVGSSPEQLAALMKSDMAKMAKLVKDAGLRPQ